MREMLNAAERLSCFSNRSCSLVDGSFPHPLGSIEQADDFNAPPETMIRLFRTVRRFLPMQQEVHLLQYNRAIKTMENKGRTRRLCRLAILLILMVHGRRGTLPQGIRDRSPEFRRRFFIL